MKIKGHTEKRAIEQWPRWHLSPIQKRADSSKSVANALKNISSDDMEEVGADGNEQNRRIEAAHGSDE
ncbi:hypothetical protein PIB30_089860 [Stylosanthes scabra]|uniref:Uncharacterized protein n=1 Tax=Stylosanthes scabra TaxID=79078 RepID=A0ABU6TW32_9FABA|nr:hypothetical protein [Stylosanthes scabra]